MKYSFTRILSIGVGVAIVVALLLLFFFNPETTPIYPRCPSRLLTGYQTAGCGSLRATHALLHGRLLQASHYNPILILAMPLDFFLLANVELSPLSIVFLKRRFPVTQPFPFL